MRYFYPKPTILSVLAAMLLSPVGAYAQQMLPRPQPAFTGKIGQTYVDSTAAYPNPVTAPAGAPNIVVILTDDVGFGAASTFGGPVPTPHLSELAAHGLVYNRFHVTAMCSPTRAALLTGRNHHAVGNGTVVDLSTGFPGYLSSIPHSAATVARILRDNGYNTAFFGKHHNVSDIHASPAGPFDQWPTGLGFEYFYGFIGAETNQFTPALYRGTRALHEPHDGMLDKALADDAIDWIHTQKAAAPNKPFFVYYAPGSAHEPHQAPRDWIEKFHGQFDAGWDSIAATTVERQRALGLLPKDAIVAPRPDGLAAWDSLSTSQRRVNARMMEVYAAMLSYQDAQIGRVFDELKRMGQFDNTLIIFIEGDNGAAAEAGPDGSSNAMATFINGMNESEAQLLAQLDKLGGPDTRENYAYGWAWALDQPFPLFKEYASHLGGTRNGMVVSWPQHIQEHGLRSQYAHVTDIAPTLLEAADVPAPDLVDGIKQQPIDGVSLMYSFGQPQAPSRHNTQYYEMMGNRAIYHDGWLANTTPAHLPWTARTAKLELPTEYSWELYDLDHDFAQSNNLAAKYPEKLQEMQQLFDKEARRNDVYPLDNRLNAARFMAGQHVPAPASGHYVYWGKNISLPVASGAPLQHNSFAVTADLELPEHGGNGVIIASGSKFGGWGFYLVDGKPVAQVAANQLPGQQYRIASDGALPSGPVQLRYDFDYDGGLNAGGLVRISVNGQEVARGRVEHTFSKYPEMTDTFDVGFDADTPVTNEYQHGGRLDAKLLKVDVQILPAAR